MKFLSLAKRSKLGMEPPCPDQECPVNCHCIDNQCPPVAHEAIYHRRRVHGVGIN